MEDLTGRQFGPYRIVGPLGEGGMAAVYKAYQPSMDRNVALKVLPRHFASDAQFVARFQREAKILAKLQHPHILPVHDFGEAGGYTYIVMPFVPTGTLAAILKGRPLPLSRIESIVTQVGAALNYAHARGLIHRDLKPSNILVDESGNCLLTDFGLARILEGAATLTATGAIMGTPAYMSPEQGLGEKLDPRTDIYSLGVVLYEMTTGRVPFSAETPMAVVVKHINDPLPMPRKLNQSLPEAVERVILKALAKSPADRYQTAGEFVKGLAAAVGEAGPLAQPAHPPAGASTRVSSRPGRPIQLPWRRVGLVAGGIVALAGLGALVANLAGTGSPEATPSRSTGNSAVALAPSLAGELMPTGEGSAVEQVSTEGPIGGEAALPQLPEEPDESIVQIVQSFPAPGEIVTGITWDGESLWFSDSGSDTIFKTDTSGNLLDAFSYEFTPVGLAWDGADLWMFASHYVGPPWDVISRFQAEEGEIKAASSFEFSVGGTGGQLRNDLEWDGQALWVSEVNQFKVFRIDTSGTILSSFPFRRPVTGLAWDGTYLWLAYEDVALFEYSLGVVDPTGDELISLITPLSEIEGLAWVDGDLWAIGADDFAGATTIFQLDVSQVRDSLP